MKCLKRPTGFNSYDPSNFVSYVAPPYLFIYSYLPSVILLVPARHLPNFGSLLFSCHPILHLSSPYRF